MNDRVMEKAPKKKHRKPVKHHKSLDLTKQNEENPQRRSSFSIDGSLLTCIELMRIDFECSHSLEDLRLLVSKSWCDHMLKRMQSVGLEVSVESHSITQIEELYILYKSL